MLRFLPSFLAVVDTGSAAAAAARLHKTAAALSYDLRQLQSLADDALFLRVGRGLRLTPAGERFADGARAAMQALAHSVDPSGHPPSPPLRVAAVSGFGRYVLLPALFAIAGPRSIELSFHRNEDVARRVREGQADLGVCFARPRSVALAFRAVYDETLALVAAPGQRVPATPAALTRWCREHPCVTYDESDYVFARWHAKALGGARHRLRQGDHYSELEEAVAAVSAGRGYSIVPGETAQRLSALHPLRIANARGARNPLYAAVRSHDAASAALVGALANVLSTAGRAGQA